MSLFQHLFSGLEVMNIFFPVVLKELKKKPILNTHIQNKRIPVLCDNVVSPDVLLAAF